MMDATLRSTAWIDVVLAILVFTCTRLLLACFSVPKAGSMAVVITLLFASGRIWLLGSGWSDFGLARPESVTITLIVALAVYLATAVAVALGINPLANALELPQPAFHKLGDLRGNTAYLLFMVFVIGWGTAAFGEEMLFRGFLQNRLVTAFGSGTSAVVFAVVVQAILFGLGHLYLGARGAMTAGSVGLVFGAAVAASAGSLWPVIVAHGVMDAISLYALYAGVVASI